ncbi:MAG TPA: serine/threonine-protein kinase [Kofleriaceae bacterium]|nr:serine/threonine-protein kinase [Kofleriaceae bacterium]
MYEPGSLLASKYRIERVLGRGGMGVVVEAEHLELRAPVALKFLTDRYTDRADVVERFLREARAAAKLRSVHACRVSDVGRLDDGTPYIVMEMLVGRDLARALREDGPLDTATAADYVAQACDAVAEAHAAGIVHRDLKPGNLFVTRQRDGAALIKVLDFGVAKVESEQEHAITSARAVIGSPSYMAPEQLRSARAADARSDIWSLGVILHQAACGKPPFQGETIADLAIRAATEPLPPLLGVPPAYAAIVARCLEKQPDQRFQSAAALADALAPLVAARRAVTQSPPPLVQPTVVLGPGTGDPSAPTQTTLRGSASEVSPPAPPRGRGRRVIVAGAGFAAALSIGIAAAIAIGGGSSALPDQPIPPAPIAAPAPPTPAAPAPPPAAAPADAATPVVATPADTAAPDAAPTEPQPETTTEAAPPAKPPHVVRPPRSKPARRKTKEEVGASRM